jgi:hypothetical protein
MICDYSGGVDIFIINQLLSIASLSAIGSFKARDLVQLLVLAQQLFLGSGTSFKTWWLGLSLDCEFKEIIFLKNVWEQASSISLICCALFSRVS